MYGKIYEITFTGSMFGSGSTMFAVWAYVIAHTTPDSMVELNPSLLAATLGDDQKRIQEVIDALCSPDPRSRTKKFEGCRLIKKSEFMYFVPTYSHYRGLRNDEERRQYFAQKKREQRQRDKDISERCQTEGQNLSKKVKHVHPSNNAYAYAFASSSVLKEGVRGRFKEWIEIRKAQGKAPKDWDRMFLEQAKWLSQFSESDQLEILSASIRNNWQGLHAPQRSGRFIEPKRRDPKEEKLEREIMESRERLKAEGKI